LIGLPSIVVGISYFVMQDTVRAAPIHGRTRLAKAGWDAYLACLKNRNLMLVSLLMMVGAAGRQGGINQTFLVPHFMFDLGIEASIAASLLTIVLVGGVVALMLVVTLKDVFSRNNVKQVA
jgi:hypothetical protein